MAAIEGSRGSFEEATAAIGRMTGQKLGKRQVETLAARAAIDVEDFYTTRRPPPGDHDDVLIISADGKGIVMRPEALRPQTARKAQAATTKLKTRLSKGEKRHRKRLAEVGAVYDLAPVPRRPTDVMGSEKTREKTGQPPAAALNKAPVAKNKWVTASVVDDAGAQRYCGTSSRKPSDATPPIPVPGWRSSTETTTRSTASRPRRPIAAIGQPEARAV